MITLQERSDAKTDRVRNAKLQLAMLDENNKRNSFCEDLEDLEIVHEPPKVEDRSKLCFADILKLSKNSPKKTTKSKIKKIFPLTLKKGIVGNTSWSLKTLKKIFQNISLREEKLRRILK